MEAEKLALEVQAARVGWNVVKPPVLNGRSGVTHSFSFLAFDGKVHFAFDIYEKVTEIEVLNTFVRTMDTGARSTMVCAGGTIEEGARNLAKEYGIKLIAATEIPKHFDSITLKKPGSN